jgi:hypoxanthine phosphoribosyltransferase
MEKTKLSNKDLLEAIYFIAKKSKIINPDVIVGIERGGMPLAIYLSAYLNVPLERVTVSFYDGFIKQDTPTVNFKNFDINDYKRPLFVDDLVDSASTMKYIKKVFNGAAFATIYTTKGASDPDLYYYTKKAGEWIIFPWDLDNDGFDYKYMKEDWWKQPLD